MPHAPLEIFQHGIRPPEYWFMRLEDQFEALRSGDIGYSTGFPKLDNLCRLQRSELTIIAARPSMGKTALALQLCENVGTGLVQADEPGVIAIFSAEMSGTQLFMRMVCAKTGISLHKVRAGQATDNEYHRMNEYRQTMRNSRLWIDDGGSPTTANMLADLAGLNEDIPVKLVMFDFLELGGDKMPNEDLRLGQIAKNLKGIAKTLDIPVIGVSQLNRQVDGRTNRMPGLADLRYSGMIEQVADVVITIMRPEYYIERGDMLDVPEEDKSGVAYVNVVKNRNGPVGACKLAFLKERVLFGNLEQRS